MGPRCSFCGTEAGPFLEVQGALRLLMCGDCQAARGHNSSPYPTLTRDELRAGLDLLPTWVLEQKAAANRQKIKQMRERLAAGEQVARMYQEPGLAWLERQAEVAEELVRERQASRASPPQARRKARILTASSSSDASGSWAGMPLEAMGAWPYASRAQGDLPRQRRPKVSDQLPASHQRGSHCGDARQPSHHTKPELQVRPALHALGYRFRKHLVVEAAGLQVRPDIVFPRRQVAVFIDSCFWHSCPEHGNLPRANNHYWKPKLERNLARDQRVNEALRASGWKVIRIWEHSR